MAKFVPMKELMKKDKHLLALTIIVKDLVVLLNCNPVSNKQDMVDNLNIIMDDLVRLSVKCPYCGKTDPCETYAYPEGCFHPGAKQNNNG